MDKPKSDGFENVDGFYYVLLDLYTVIKAMPLQQVMSDVQEVFDKHGLRKLEREVVLDILRDLEKKKAMIDMTKKTLGNTMSLTKSLFGNR